MAQMIIMSAVGMALSYLASMLRDPIVNKGSRLRDLEASDSAYGESIQRGWGTYPAPAHLVWANDITETEHEKTMGKGMSGGSSSIWYTYSCSFAVSFGQGPIEAYSRIWADTKLIYDARPNAKVKKRQDVMTLYYGTEDQLPDPLIESILGDGEVPAYRGQAYIVFDELELADFGNRIPNITAELITVLDPAGANVTETHYDASGLGGGVADVEDIRVVKDTGTYVAVSDDGFCKVHTPADTLVSNGYPYSSRDVADWDIMPDSGLWVLDHETSPARLLSIDTSDMSLHVEISVAQTTLTVAGAAKAWERLCLASADNETSLAVLACSGLRHPTLYPGDSDPWLFLAVYRQVLPAYSEESRYITTHYIEDGLVAPGIFAQLAAGYLWIALSGPTLAKLRPHDGITELVDLGGSLAAEIVDMHVFGETLILLCDDDTLYPYDTVTGTLGAGLASGRHSRTRYPLQGGTRIWCQSAADWSHFEVELDGMTVVREINSPLIVGLTDGYDPVTDALYQPCTDSVPTLSGSDAVTKPGGYQYAMVDPVGPVEWSVSGTGASIDQTGYVTLEASACGAITVTGIDACGREASADVRVTNAGQWVLIGSESAPCTPSVVYCLCPSVGKYLHHMVSTGGGPCAQEHWLTNHCPGVCFNNINVIYTFEWQC